jgi:hypothetical protein
MKDAELFPVSFFSNAFDLIQKVQNDFHTLEADQVEMFASQMKKHQDLITSIHQQVRTIESISEAKKPDEAYRPTTITPEQPRPPIADYIIPQYTDNMTVKSDNTRIEKPRKPSIFSRIAGKEEMPHEAEVKETLKQIETPKPVEKEPVPPVEIKENSAPISTPIIIPQKTVENIITPTAETPPTPPVIVAEIKEEPVTVQHLSVNENIEKNKLSDLRKAFNLNDRFRYQRELFGGREDVMSRVIAELNNKSSYRESIAYLEDELHWDISDLTVKDFMKKLELRFL